MSDMLSALRLFVRVAATGTFSQAAREQKLSQATASRIIAQLEEELGATLFVRSTRALTLTEAGSDYLARIKPVLQKLDEAAHFIQEATTFGVRFGSAPPRLPRLGSWCRGLSGSPICIRDCV
jgi:DNA-binding transcriptional LysR family regulator